MTYYFILWSNYAIHHFPKLHLIKKYLLNTRFLYLISKNMALLNQLLSFLYLKIKEARIQIYDLQRGPDEIVLVNKKKAELNQKNLELKKSAKKILDIINRTNYKFSKRAKDNDELYGSIKPMEISKAIENAHKIKIKPSQIDLGNKIEKVGSYEAKINLHAEIQARILIAVVKEEDKT